MSGRVGLAVVAVLAMAGCGDSTSVQPEPVAPSHGVAATGLLDCEPLAPATTTATLGPGGGTIAVGPHRLDVPPGALAAPATVSASIVPGRATVVRLEPHGLTFAVPVRLTMSYAHCGLAGWLLPVRIAYTSDVFAILSYVPSLDARDARAVSGDLDHFSNYAVAW